MKVLIIGANGQLGVDLVNVFRAKEYDVITLNHEQVSVVNQKLLAKLLTEMAPNVVINTAAMHNVEDCEEKPEASFQVNGLGASNLSTICEEIGATLVHFSTDYIFDGRKKSSYIESDLPNPLNTYGVTKLAGEHYIQAISKKYYVIRVSGLYGNSICRAKGLNFVDLMIKLSKEKEEIRVVDNEILTPTSTHAIAQQVEHLVSNHGAYGIYHMTAQGACSWNRFAKQIFYLIKASVILKIANPDEFPMKTLRPTYSVLENRNLKEQKLDIMPTWEECLRVYVEGKNII